MIKKISIKVLFAFVVLSAMSACDKETVRQAATSVVINEVPQSENPLVNLMLKACNSKEVVLAMHNEALSSLDAGLEESVYFDEVIGETGTKSQDGVNRSIIRNFLMDEVSSSNRLMTKNVEVFDLNGIEIYWPYSDNWDGVSQPVVVLNTGDDNQYIEADKTFAYRFVQDGDDVDIETIIVDERYAEENPVWVINHSDVSLSDIVSLKTGNYEGTAYVPRKVADSDRTNVCELMANTIKSVKQHDDWLNGGSEYIIYWFFPYGEDQDKLKYNCTSQIKISRKEIKAGKARTINFVGNFDWAMAQRYNKLKVIEFDPGADINIPIKLSVEVKGVKLSIETKISINKNDERVMEYEIPRSALFTTETKVSDTEYTKSFYGDGVTVKTTLTSYESVPEI